MDEEEDWNAMPVEPVTMGAPVEEEEPDWNNTPVEPVVQSSPRRPFNPGEKVDNSDGSYSTERTVTVQMPDGQWAVVPSLWMENNSPRDYAPEGDDYIAEISNEYETSSKKKFPRFSSIDEAEKFAVERSAGGGASTTLLASDEEPDWNAMPVEEVPDRKTITQAEMLQNPEKMSAIRDYMIDRKGTQWRDRPDDELLDTFVSHMRWIDSNEVSTMGELRYVMGADAEKKGRVKAAYDTYDDLSSFLTNDGALGAAEGAWEYTKATLFAPSTWIGGIIGGKLASKTLSATAKKTILDMAVREALQKGGQPAANDVIKSAVKSKVKTAIVAGTLTDASLSTVQDAMYQSARMEVGAQDDYSVLQGGIAAAGGLLGGVIAYTPHSLTKNMSGLANADLKLSTVRKLRAIKAGEKAAPRIEKAIQNVTKSIKDWTDMVKDGKAVMGDPLEEVGDKLAWFFDTNNPESVARIIIDSGADLDLSKEAEQGFTEQLLNFARELPQESLDSFNKILEPQGITFGHLLDTIATAQHAVGQGLYQSSEAKRYAMKVSEVMIANKTADKNIIGIMKDTLDMPEPEYDSAQVARYTASLWRRMLVSHPGTTMLNVVGWGEAFGARSIAEMVHGGTLGTLGYMGKLMNKEWGDKQLHRSKALLQNQKYKLQMLLDPYSTREGFKALVDRLPNKSQKAIVQAYFGGVDRMSPQNIYKVGDGPVVKGAEFVADWSATLSLVKAQDVLTKSFSAISDLDRLSRLHYGRGLGDLMEKGETNLLTEDMWNTSLNNMLKDTFSVDHTRGEGRLNQLAGVVEKVSNAPYLGFLFPFGRFMNNNLAMFMEYSPIGFLPLASKIYRDKAVTFNTQEKVMRAMVGTTALATFYNMEGENQEEGKQWYQTEDSTGAITTRANISPENTYRILSRMVHMGVEGQPISKEMMKELWNVLGPGQWARQANSSNPLTDVIDYLRTANLEDQQAYWSAVGEIAKGLSGIASGFTRPLDTANKLSGFARDNDVQIDRRLASSTGDAIIQELTRYTNSLFSPFIGEGETQTGVPIIGEAKRSATRPEGDIRDPNPVSSLMSRKEEPPLNNIDRLLGMVNLPPFSVDQRSGIPEFDHFVNEEVAPILNREARRMLEDPLFERAPEYIKVKRVNDMIGQVREEVIRSLQDGNVGSPDDQLYRERSAWTSLSQEDRQMARRELGIDTPDRELSKMQLEVLKEYIKTRNEYLGIIGK